MKPLNLEEKDLPPLPFSWWGVMPVDDYGQEKDAIFKIEVRNEARN